MSATWVIALILVATSVNVVADTNDLGVNWGTLTSHPIDPKIVVQLLNDNGFKKVKLFDSDPRMVAFLAGTGIEVMLGIPNDQLEFLSIDYEYAKEWVQENCTSHLRHGGVNIKYVAVGNEPFLTSYKGRFTKTAFPAMKNIQRALNEEGVGKKIKAVMPLNADVYESRSDKPSDGVFRSDIRDLMNKIVRFLKDNNSPFVVNIYPFLSLYLNSDFPSDFAFFDGGYAIQDKNVQYTNVFEANFDTLVYALKNAGTPNLSIIVGEIGWPTDGHKSANKGNAKKFYDGLFRVLASDKGTPLRPGEIEVYLFGLFDEDTKSIEPGKFERHWGIFDFDGKPKFAMDMSGNGAHKELVGAKGVNYLPKQWCVLASYATDQNLIDDRTSWACSKSDCTALQDGASCSSLEPKRKTSYAFNSYYQMNDQHEEACDFEGLGMIVNQNPSTNSCKFSTQIEVDGATRLSFAYGAIASLVSSVTLFNLL
ncbi:Glucan endo-1,3-beta-glucosidase 8 [Hibiscus syriacus]|uniref:glucan endo-1,3-beta-D-glucosidase n=1 Tax=Hibiscus syriacus TaxID=106335 RepID=A0A6A2XM42_HIBSY|nr:glucan endo-1,3-beta-glucosidase 8-like [Hibiscus syriacus]KAE8676562.1 Glucan endo-1,3-beta-glucosidase 8 [Hibiscus syriacus]